MTNCKYIILKKHATNKQHVIFAYTHNHALSNIKDNDTNAVNVMGKSNTVCSVLSTKLYEN